jgi:hypothetical protein
MATREIARRDWRRYCDRLSKELQGQRAELDVISLDLGDRAEARWLPLVGLVYEPKMDAIEIALEGLGHSIREPRELYVEETDRGIVSLEIITAAGAVEAVRFRQPLALPPLETSEVDEVKS